MPNPLATIALVPREQFGTTERSLETLFEREKEPFELVCVDGGSPPDVQRYLERAARQRDFTLLRTDAFLTPNQARNIAVEHVRTPYVVFIDNDVLIQENYLAPLVECAEETGAWVVGPLYFEFEPECDRLHMFGGECRIQRLPGGGRDYVEKHLFAHQRIADLLPRFRFDRQETQLIEFHSVLVAMEAFRRLGPLDEGLLSNMEHGDLCLMVRNAGKQVFLEPRSRMTYTPPHRLEGADLEFYRLRWSEAWTEATHRRLRAKWNLAPDSPGIRQSTRWTREHRRHSLAWLPNVRRILGRKPARWLENHLVDPLEAAANRRRHPIETCGRVPRPAVRVVHAPRNQVCRAA